MSTSQLGILVMSIIALFYVNCFGQQIEARMVEENLFQSQVIIMKSILENTKWSVSERITAEGGLDQRVQEPRVYFGKWRNHQERDRFVRVVLALVGTPYVLGGSTASGMDCSHFIQCVYELFDVPLPRTVRKLFLVGKVVDKPDIVEGDLVFFNGPGKPSHVGIYVGGDMYAHASSAAKMIRVDSVLYPWNSGHYVGAVRVRELEGHEKR